MKKRAITILLAICLVVVFSAIAVYAEGGLVDQGETTPSGTDFSGDDFGFGDKDIKLLGDVNEDGFVTSDDAIYLLHSLFEPEDYPLYPTQTDAKVPNDLEFGDVNGDGVVTSDDAIYLLHSLFEPEDYPLYPDNSPS